MGPCDWDIPAPVCCPAWDDADAATRQRAVTTATYLLWAATGRQFGRCETAIRPCRRSCDPAAPARCGGAGWSYGQWWASVDSAWGGPPWLGARCGCRRRAGCSCRQVCEVDLPGWYPEPTQVRVDGVVVPLAEFRVDNGRWLVWERPCEEGAPCAQRCFPACQDLTVSADCEGTWEVTYRHGIPVPDAGRYAASELVCEVIQACTGDGECRLPSNVSSISRQGVDMEFVSTGSVVTSGRLTFGVPSVDLWVAAVNPYGVTGPVQVYSPDVPAARLRTWP